MFADPNTVALLQDYLQTLFGVCDIDKEDHRAIVYEAFAQCFPQIEKDAQKRAAVLANFFLSQANLANWRGPQDEMRSFKSVLSDLRRSKRQVTIINKLSGQQLLDPNQSLQRLNRVASLGARTRCEFELTSLERNYFSMLTPLVQHKGAITAQLEFRVRYMSNANVSSYLSLFSDGVEIAHISVATLVGVGSWSIGEKNTIPKPREIEAALASALYFSLSLYETLCAEP